MSTVHHQNIVHFYGIEQIQDIEQTRRAIVMEYCSDGNLMQKIDANPNGFGRAEFFHFATQFVSGFEYLIHQNIAHRDLKPDNVMVSMCSNGLSCYKIGDFGAARQLKRREKYSSLYGTYEYLHPDLFIKYYYRLLGIKPKVNEFDCTHDFWSLGVTLYEVATGSLPFAPTNNRGDKKIMFEMITQKKPGDIAAVQTENGIEWLNSLPDYSSVATDEHVTQFLAKLIDVSRHLSIYD